MTIPIEKRPERPIRAFSHVAGGCAYLLAIHHLFVDQQHQWFATSFASALLLFDLLRFKIPSMNAFVVRQLPGMLHQGEQEEINSATWFWISTTVVAWLCSQEVLSVALMLLTVGDKTASIIGRRFGAPNDVGTKQRSWAGTISFILAGGAVSMVVILNYFPERELAQAILMVGVGTCAGAFCERYSGRLDDNLTIALGSALSMSIIAS